MPALVCLSMQLTLVPAAVVVIITAVAAEPYGSTMLRCGTKRTQIKKKKKKKKK
jgi:hypothetical protein